MLFAVDLLKAVPGPTCSYYEGADFTVIVPHLFWGLGVLGNYWAHILPRKETDLDDDGPNS